MKNYFHKTLAWLRARRGEPKTIPSQLDPAILEQALAEARFLFSRHAVDVTSLAAGEEAGLPRSADPHAIIPERQPD